MSNKDKSLIPHGAYCYEVKNSKFCVCKYWSAIQLNDNKVAVCSFLEKDENDDGYFLLSDQVKCCDENEDEENYD